MSIYNWVDSFTVRILRHTESTSKRLGKKKRIKVNKTIAKQITDDEKLIITTIDFRFTTAFINAGDYFLSQVISTLAQHTSSFAPKRYIPYFRAPQDNLLPSRSIPIDRHSLASIFAGTTLKAKTQQGECVAQAQA